MPKKNAYLLTPLAAAVASLTAHHALADTVNLDAVTVVSASGFEQNIADAPASISSISGEELNKKSYTNVLDAIKNIPGVYMTGGGSMGDISIRGMSSEYTMYLVDGRPISQGRSVNTNGTDGGKQIGLPPVSMIERIEVIRGPMSSLYGADAMGGIINIITKKTTGEWAGNINTEYTHSLNKVSNDEQKVDLMAGGALINGLLGLQVRGSWAGTDESTYQANTNKDGASKPDGENKEAGAKLTFTPNENNDFSLDLTKARREYTHNPGKSLAANSDPLYTHYEKDIYVLTHEGRYDNWLVDSYIQHDISDNVQPDTSELKREKATIANTQATTFVGNHTFTMGGRYTYESLRDDTNALVRNNSPAAKPRVSHWMGSLFGEVESGLTEDFFLTTGLRYDRDENFGNHFSPRLYGVYHLTDTFSLKGGVSTGYKKPSLGQITEGYAQGTGGRGNTNHDGTTPAKVILGNPNLKPEQSVSYELGYVFEDHGLGINTSVMLFHTEFKDKIATEILGDCENAPDASCQFGGVNYKGVDQYINVDKAEMQGMEATVDYWITQRIKVGSSYTYTRSKQKSGAYKGEPLNKTPKHMVNLSTDWQATEKLSAWAQYNYRGKTSAYYSPGGANKGMNKGTPGYGFFDVGLAYQLNPKAQVKFGVYNVANDNVTNEDYEVVLDGRRLNLGLSVDF